MSPTHLDRARRTAAALLIGGCAAYVLTFLFVALARIGYPFELEWMEGGMVDHLRRAPSGLPI